MDVLRDHNYDLTNDEVRANYEKLITHCQRHRLNHGYCQKNNECRFGFPRKIQSESKLIVNDIVYKRGEKKGQLKTSTLEMTFKSNDRWLNSHSQFGLMSWAANMDMSILIDSHSTIKYIAKYCNKVEGASTALHSLIRDGVRQSTDEGMSEDSKRVLRRTFNRLSGRRDKCSMDISHLILSSFMVLYDHQFIHLNIFGGSQALDLDVEDENESCIKKTFLELYTQRLDGDSWKDSALYQKYCPELLDMPLLDFIEWLVARRGKIYSRLTNSKPIIPLIFPKVSHLSNESHTSFYIYCFINLIKYIPWAGNMCSVFDDPDGLFPSSRERFATGKVYSFIR